MVCLIAFLYNRYPQLHFFFPSNIQRRTTKYLAVFCWDSLLVGTGLKHPIIQVYGHGADGQNGAHRFTQS